MSRMSLRGFLSLVVLFAPTGCSDNSVAPIDQGATIAKVSGGEGSARVSAKAKQASEAAAKSHPKLH